MLIIITCYVNLRKAGGLFLKEIKLPQPETVVDMAKGYLLPRVSCRVHISGNISGIK